MFWGSLTYLLVISTLALCIENKRTSHRLIGGHLKIFHEDPDDTEALIVSASGSKDRKTKKSDDDERKTLSQQVADGKYGLIQKELFTKPIKRPGVISYDANPEVPKDNINNLGGLTKNDIWLAENHLLVVKGGSYPQHDDKKDTHTGNTQPWPPIDDYKAPLRQVKIPAHPKVPPPFPVQLHDDGPLQILGTNFTRTINGTFDPSSYAIPPPDFENQGYEGPFFPPPFPVYPNTANITAGQTPFPIPPYAPPAGEYPKGAPFPPFLLNGTLPPFFASLPPGAAILPPPQNQTDFIDEDDPSIYYPPPYSFYYPKDNTSKVPAGPLVPGIVLPPPPNFFGPLEDTTTTTKKAIRNRIKFTTTTQLPQIHPTTTPIPPTAVLEKEKDQPERRRKPVRIFPVHIPSEINNELNPIVTTTTRPNLVTILPVRQQQIINRTQKPSKRPAVTILKPVKTSTVPPKIYVLDNEVSRKPFDLYGPPTSQKVKTVISTTQVPLKLYYSTANEIETNSITQSPERFHIGINQRYPKTTTTNKAPAQYYFYEEQQPNPEVTTIKPVYKSSYYDIPPKFYFPQKAQNVLPQTQRPQFIYVNPSPQRRPPFRFVQQPPKDSFSIHIARLQKQIHQYITTPRPQYRPSPKPVYQFSFQAANYKSPSFQQQQNDDPQDKFRPLPRYSVQIQPAIEIIPTEQPPPVYQTQASERPQSTKYYSTPKPPDYEYEDQDVEILNKPQRLQEAPQKQRPQGRPISQYSYEATPNPIYQGYYTKPDEGYFDENTKQYFTSFGKKLPNTTPLPEKLQRPKSSNLRQPQNPISLHSDTHVNYLNPRPALNPESEYVTPSSRGKYPQVVKYTPRPLTQSQYQQNENRNAPEIVKAIPVDVPTGEGQSGSFISYQLPGDDGAHFYFLTPQLAQRRDQGSGFYFEQADAARNRRNNGRTR